MDSGLFSQQSSLDDNEDPSHPNTPAVATSASCSGDGPLEDYTKYNSSLPAIQPVKVS